MSNIDLSTAKLVSTQNWGYGGPGRDPVGFVVRYYELPDGRIVLNTDEENIGLLETYLRERPKL